MTLFKGSVEIVPVVVAGIDHYRLQNTAFPSHHVLIPRYALRQLINELQSLDTEPTLVRSGYAGEAPGTGVRSNPKGRLG